MWRISCFSKGQIHSVNADLHAENSSENDAYGTTWLYLDKRKLLVKVAQSSVANSAVVFQLFTANI